MKSSEVEKYLNKKVKIILTNNFHFTGKVLEVSETTLFMKDKFDADVSLNLKDIMICSEDLE